MTYLIYDGTFEGLISAIFDVYERKLENVMLRSQDREVADLFAQKITVDFDQEKFDRVRLKLIAYLGNAGFSSLWKATLTESEEVDDVLLNIIKYTFKEKTNILKNYGNPYVLQLQQILKKLSRERHRMTAFVRFELGNDGIYYASIEPDFNVLPIISQHFKNRYADQKWLIFDLKRKYAIYYDLEQVRTMEIVDATDTQQPAILKTEWAQVEFEYQKLWKNYFKSTNIKSRKNMKLHLQHVPKRYWKYLTEK